jgi:hypothetical protein
MVIYDFSEPSQLPLTKLGRFEDWESVVGWENNDTFVFECDYQIRKSDGAKYNTLSEEEQIELDRDNALSTYVREQIRWSRLKA